MKELAAQSNLLVILGPTGSGKSDLGLTLAEAFDGEIISCDSVQVYRHLNIGSAKTPVSERRGIRHHLIDVADVAEHFTAGDFQRLARQAIASVLSRGKLPVVVGGTGLYLRALLLGLSDAPQRDEALRHRLRRIAARRPRTLHRLLEKRDPVAAGRIHPNDQQKLIRALEVIAASGESASTVQDRPRDVLTGYRAVKLGLHPPRALLNEELNARCVSMFEHGLLEETRQLLAAGNPEGSKPLQSLGYKQAVAVLDGRATRLAAIDDCQNKTRQYAKRQLTWFRRELDVHWLTGFGTDEKIQKEAIVFLRALPIRP